MHIEPKVLADARGFFLETYNKDRYAEAGFPDVEFVQDNHSRSSQGVLRVWHCRLNHLQGKLVQLESPLLSDKDVAALCLADISHDRLPKYQG